MRLGSFIVGSSREALKVCRSIATGVKEERVVVVAAALALVSL